jgi:hypothetical protein
VQDAYQIWFAVMGPKVKAMGEMKTNQQFYQKQLAQTAAQLTGHTYEAVHGVSAAIPVVQK